ncbi:uncharacterized protein [Chironomus tepperi]|uniref:uncharacterized protein n=1 Tax=Chironomus tepperi TaxID=113505 RepID=UPI00391FB7F5
MELKGKSSLGSTYPGAKWIFIGAKSSKLINREQEIKGVISHEICHYVMGLVYQNNDSPFFENDPVRSKQFEDIVDEYNKWKVYDDEDEAKIKEEVDDECNGIISTVYTHYAAEDHIAELIVRGPHIQAQFDNDNAKEEHLEELYKKLFDYMDTCVIPDLISFNLEKREKIQQLNKILRFLKEVKTLDFEFLEPKNLNIDNEVTIISTNIPKLLLANIYNYIEEKDAKLLDSRNVFVPSNFNSFDDILKDYKEVLKQNSNLNIFVDCTKGIDGNLQDIAVDNTNKFIFLIKNDNQYDKIFKYLTSNDVQHNRVTIDYSWNDLTVETQHKLLETKINFQGNSAVSLNQLVSINDFSQIFDDQQLNLLLEKSEISINLNFATLDDNFKALFTPREFIKKQKNSTESVNLSQDELIKDIEGEKFILISDNAGAGKSWTLKNIAYDLRTANPNRWISYVELKHFIKEFKSYKTVPELQNFMKDCILKSLNQFEIKMFLHLYKNGKVSILFDAFDEIAPDCASFVLNMIKPIKGHEGIQLWITSRDYFEADLSTELNINSIYKLEPLTPSQLVTILAAKLKLNDSRSEGQMEIQDYQNNARKLIQRIHLSRNSLIGSPQFFRMIADVYESIKDKVFVITCLSIYGKFVFIQYEIWSRHNGVIREEANAIFQQESLNFFDLHKFFALKSYKPNQNSFCDIEFLDDNLNDALSGDQIIGCGFLTKIGDLYLFTHETFREYFVAVFFIDILRKNRSRLINGEFCELFIHFLTGQQFQVIRMFLNEGFEEDTISKIINKQLSKFAEPFFKNIENLKNLSELFEENCKNLKLFIIRLFKYGTYQDVQTILTQSPKIISLIINQPDLFTEFHDYIINILDKSNLKSFVMNNQIIQHLIRSQLDVKYLNDFLDNLSQKMDNSELKEIAMTLNNNDENLLLILFKITQDFRQKFDSLFKFINSILSQTEILKLISQSNKYQENVLHICTNNQDKEKLETVWTMLKNLNSVPQLRDLFTKKLLDKVTPLHVISYNKDIDFHLLLWTVLLEAFINNDELHQLLHIKDDNGNNFIHILMHFNTAEVIELALQKIKENLNDSHYQEILRSKGESGRNLLHLATVSSKEVKTHQILWKTFQDFCNSNDEFLEILREVDHEGNDVFNIAAIFTTGEVLQFMINELRRFASREEIRKLLKTLGFANRNLLQNAPVQNKCLELHEALWEIIENYIDASEILQFIMHRDGLGLNLLLNVTIRNTKEIKELTWDKVKNVLNINGFEDEKCDEIMKKELKFEELTKEEKEILGLEWISIDNSVELFEDKIQLFNNRTISVTSLKDLLLFITDEKIENHQMLWENLKENCQNKEDLKKMFLEKEKDIFNYIHLLLNYSTADIIEFTINKFKEHFSDSDYQEILRSKGELGRNLLHRAAIYSKEIKIHEILWKTFREFCKSDEEFLEINCQSSWTTFASISS